jgi:radical SAM superfamily enzyme YgiQ (UPF0313 family)
MALVGRLLERHGFRVAVLSQPDWHSPEAFRALGKPNLYFGITAGNMDSMINRYTSERKIRSEDAYTPNGEADKRPLVVAWLEPVRAAGYDLDAREARPPAGSLCGYAHRSATDVKIRLDRRAT